MQDVQNIPAPDDDTSETNDDFGSHSRVDQDLDNEDIEQPSDAEDIVQEDDPQTGIEQYPDTSGGRGDENQNPDIEPQ